MQTEMPFYEREEDALKACVQALGGSKKVGANLWPTDKSVNDAQRYLNDCLNPDRAEKLSYKQVTWIFKEAKKVGFHEGFNWFARECEYEATPINPEVEKERLLSVVENTSKILQQAMKDLQNFK